MAKTVQEWLKFVHGYTIVKNKEDALKIAEALAAAPEGSTCVWHEHSKFYNNLDKCWCQKCRRSRNLLLRRP